MENKAWHILDIHEVGNILKTSLQEGLSGQHALELLEQYGPNELEHGKSKTVLSMFIDQFKNFMVIILLIAAVISGLLGEVKDTVIILAIVILNSVLGTAQENKAEKSLAALKKMAAPHAKVIRDGQPESIPASQLVPGDLVVLEAGDFVPADLRLTESANLKIQEAALTGESVPVEKSTDSLDGRDIPLGDRTNMAYSGSIVTYGRGRGIVVATGMDTEMGKIAHMLQKQEGVKTPLQKRMENLGKTMGVAVLAICGIIFLVGILYGKEIFAMFFTSVSLAVAAIPEGLPAIVTVVLAIGVQRMIRRNAIIRKLPAVETLGSATVICSDKTGTLTENRMTVERVYYNGSILRVKEMDKERTDNTFRLLVQIGLLCNDSQVKNDGGTLQTIGDPTETALVDLAFKMGMDKDAEQKLYPRVGEIPFDSDRKLMTTLHQWTDGYRVYTKGAPDELLSRCTHILVNDGVMELDEDMKNRVLSANRDMGYNALRVLGAAYKPISQIPQGDREQALENKLIFVGLFGMIDPPRPEVMDAVMLCKRAGIKPVMITGDHKITAVAIARALGMLKDESEAISGGELDAMTQQQLEDNVDKYSVYARVSPEHKMRIIKAWQARGQVVAMTGDGVNDAPALKSADIGVAMGITGTDVAKEASDMVLTDDNFATIVSAVREGRVIYTNILKTIQFLLSCNVGEILVLLVATLANWDIPLLPIHILWVNLVTDSFPALALGVDPPEAGIMDKKPRSPKKGVFDKGMIIRICYQGVMVGTLTLIAFLIGKATNTATGQTMAFSVLAISQLIHVFNVRSNERSLFRTGLLSNGYLLWAVAVSLALQLLVMLTPGLTRLFSIVQLNFQQWLAVVVLSLMPIAVVEILKLLKLNSFEGE
ncbi:MAG TPA: calcium-transporting P-type ATPase, PMR1-type [Clostridiales bacterium]|nr:calcium-transporting P-type ATPase, PMR1-type [Clostridiales bacterium]